MLVLAHRGFHSTAQENTLDAFDRAAELGVDGIETDVRLSADGHLVLFHDPCTPNGLQIRDCTYAHLCSDVKYKIPLLAEAVERHPDLLWNLEIKTSDALLLLVDYIRPRANRHSFFVTSFLHRSIEQLASSVAVECGLLISHDPTDKEISVLVSQPRSQVKSIVMDFEMTTKQSIQKFKEADFKTWVYNVQKDASIDFVERFGFFGVVTDAPNNLIAKAEFDALPFKQSA